MKYITQIKWSFNKPVIEYTPDSDWRMLDRISQTSVAPLHAQILNKIRMLISRVDPVEDFTPE